MVSRGLLRALPQRFPQLQLKKPSPPGWFGARTRKTVRKPARSISVVIPAHNEESYIAQTLESLKRQNYARFETIVVANGCGDGTAEVAKGRCDRLIVLSQKSLGVARNLGARMAKGEILVFLDADTRLEPMALRIISENFSKRDAAATLRGVPDAERFRYRLLYLYKNFTHCTSLHRGSAGVIICWRKHFMQAGGFDEGLEVCENSELIKRLRRFGKYKFISDASATTSMRRFEQRGFWPMFLVWAKLWVRRHFGDLHMRHYEAVR